MLGNKYKLLLVSILSIITLFIPSLVFLFIIIFLIVLFDYLFIYNLYLLFTFVLFLLLLIFENLNIAFLICMKFILIFIYISNYIKKTSIKEFYNTTIFLLNPLKIVNMDVNKLSKKITVYTYIPYIINRNSNKIKKSLALLGLDIYHSNFTGKVIVYKYIFNNIYRLVKVECAKIFAIL